MIEMSEYTPSTDEVRRGYPRSYHKSMEAEYAEFDRWLAARDAQVRAEALGGNL